MASSFHEGTSLGVALLTTLLAQRPQAHQVYLGAQITSMSHATGDVLARATQLAQSAGGNPGMAHQQALAILYNVLQQQSMLMAYLDALAGL